MPRRRGASGRWFREHLDRRIWPLLVSVAFVGLGTAYVFTWSDVVQHHPFQWLAPGDLLSTYRSATELAFGHFGAVYSRPIGHVDTFPGMLVLLAPLGALATTFHTRLVHVAHAHHPLAHLGLAQFQPSGILSVGPGAITIHADQYVVQPQWVAFVVPYTLILSCSALFACDALAERLGADRRRRVVLVLAEAVLLWNVAVRWGHPEDAVGIALAVYAVVLVLDGRIPLAGWVFGAAVCFQPLVLLVLPVLLVSVGRHKALGMIIRSAVPAAVLVSVPLAAGFSTTLQALVKQRAYPNVNHQTPWTALAPRLGGRGTDYTVASGPGRLVSIVLACGLGVAVRRWRERPEVLVLGCAVALALWPLTESVMTAYYMWPALALALVVASRARPVRFAAAAVLSIATTVAAQSDLSWMAWWLLVTGGLVATLVVAAAPAPTPADVAVTPGRLGSWMNELLERSAQEAASSRRPAATKARRDTSGARRRRKASRTSRKRTASRR